MGKNDEDFVVNGAKCYCSGSSTNNNENATILFACKSSSVLLDDDNHRAGLATDCKKENFPSGLKTVN